MKDEQTEMNIPEDHFGPDKLVENLYCLRNQKVLQ